MDVTISQLPTNPQMTYYEATGGELSAHDPDRVDHKAGVLIVFDNWDQRDEWLKGKP